MLGGEGEWGGGGELWPPGVGPGVPPPKDGLLYR